MLIMIKPRQVKTQSMFRENNDDLTLINSMCFVPYKLSQDFRPLDKCDTNDTN